MMKKSLGATATAVVTVTLVLLACHNNLLITVASASASAHPIQNMDLNMFTNILSSELDAESYEDAQITLAIESKAMMMMMMTNGNNSSSSSQTTITDDDDSSSSTTKAGYVICHAGKGLTGFERRRELEADLATTNLEILSNTKDLSCFSTTLSIAAVEVRGNNMYIDVQSQNAVFLHPMTSSMKMRRNVIDLLKESSSSSSSSTSDYTRNDILLQVCPGAVDTDDEDTTTSSSIMEDLGDILISRIRQSSSGRSLSKSKSKSKSTLPSQHEFPWTSSYVLNAADEVKQTFTPTHHQKINRWRKIWEDGINNADHQCAGMFDAITVDGDDGMGVVSLSIDDADATDVNCEDCLQSCVLSLIASLSAAPEVCSVDAVPEVSTMNDIAQWITQSGVDNYRPFWDKGLTGSGQIVQVSDTGLDTNHCSFWDSSPGELRDGTIQPDRRKVILYEAYANDAEDSNDGHGTHVTGSIVGHKSVDGTVENETDGLVDGMAKDAKVAFFDIGTTKGTLDVPLNDELFMGGYTAGAKFHSASWGSTSSDYTSYAQWFDYFAQVADDFLPLVAAGNNGFDASTGGTIMESVGNPALAKNVITVGATQSTGRDIFTGMKGLDYLANFSSRGPTLDGRTKPDIVAPGAYVVSAGSRIDEIGECEPPHPSRLPTPTEDSDDYAVASFRGTSMATPVTTGTAALVRQYFVEGWYPLGIKGTGTPIPSPSASLIKAVLLNGAQSILGVQLTLSIVKPVSDYDNNANFGRINLLSSLTLDGENDFATEVHDRVPMVNGDEHVYTYQIGESCESTSDLSATLVWTDPYGAPGCMRCLINDLDITMEKQDGVVVYANGKDDFDRVNNAERIRVPATPGDTFTVRVYGSNLATLFQNYALVVTGCFGENYPTRSPTKSSSPTTSSMPTTSSAPSPVCEDLPGWVDFPDGNDCSFYEATDAPGCPNSGAYSSADGIYAMDACCYCGKGDLNVPSSAPSTSMKPSTSSAPTRICDDLPGWVDARYGLTCADYEDDWLLGEPIDCDSPFGYLFDESGINANEACCWCGGGSNPMEGLVQCEDTPGWMDSYGDGCAWYLENDPFCAVGSCCNAGMGTALENCCQCGGGNRYIEGAESPSISPSLSQVPSVNPTTSVLPSTSHAPNYCVDEADWYDAFGDNCTWYDDHPFVCEEFGDCCDAGVGTPNKACCVCGGGSLRLIDGGNNSTVTASPMVSPSASPTVLPSDRPTAKPTVVRSSSPSKQPSLVPNVIASSIPSANPSDIATNNGPTTTNKPTDGAPVNLPATDAPVEATTSSPVVASSGTSTGVVAGLSYFVFAGLYSFYVIILIA